MTAKAFWKKNRSADGNNDKSNWKMKKFSRKSAKSVSEEPKSSPDDDWDDDWYDWENDKFVQKQVVSKALWMRDFRVSWKLWVVITAVMALMLFALFYATAGMDGGVMVIQQFYTLFAALIPVFYIGTTATKLIAAQIDNGSFSYVMSAPLKRRTVTLTQASFLVASLTVMYIVFIFVGLIAFACWGKMLEMKVFFLLTIGSWLFNLMICGIGYFATCLFNSAGASTSLGTGLPLGFFLLYIVATFFGSNELLSYCKYFTINSLYNPTDIIACNSNMAVEFIVMLLIAVVLFVAGMSVFKKKDLPL